MDSSDEIPSEPSLTLRWSQLEDDLSRVESDHAFEITIRTQDGPVALTANPAADVYETVRRALDPDGKTELDISFGGVAYYRTHFTI